jgi:aryl-phospho-beta-D-glucosidase BglC (GH1 family)
MNSRIAPVTFSKCLFWASIFILMVANMFAQTTAQSTSKGSRTPVDIDGKLSISEGQLVNAQGKAVVLKGLSLFDVRSYEKLTTLNNLIWFRDTWGINVLRASMYTEANGHFVGPTAEAAARRVVQTAIDAGLYVLVDWHILFDGNPQKYKKEAISFFAGMAKDFGKYPNVIFEICNEPNGQNVDWSGQIRPYAVDILKAIRPMAPNTLVIVGTPNWSQGLDEAAADPLEDNGVMYACHFYSGTHHQELRSKVDVALNSGLAVFVSEWGSTMANGTDGVYLEDTLDWFDYLNANNISHCVWSLSDGQEDSALFKYPVLHPAPWADGDFTEAGLLDRNMISGKKSATWFADNFESGKLSSGHWITSGGARMARRGAGFNSDKSAMVPAGGELTRVFNTRVFKGIKFSFSYKTIGSEAARVWYKDGVDWKELATLKPSADWARAELALPESAEGRAQLSVKIVGPRGSGNLASAASPAVKADPAASADPESTPAVNAVYVDDAELFAELTR